MTDFSHFPPLKDSLTSRIKLSAPKMARAKLADLLEKSADLAALVVTAPHLARLLEGIADHSPYHWRLISLDPQRLCNLLSLSAQEGMFNLLHSVGQLWQIAEREADVLRELRRAKQTSALLIALADLGQLWTVEQVTRALSDFADAAVACALNYALKLAIQAGRLNAGHGDTPSAACGLVVLALGKHGARELNYSSDVDLVVFYDPNSAAVPAGQEPSQLYVRITRELARLLQERTGDGYVLRVDYRLRPDPGSTHVAVSLPAAFAYYEMLGQNWERAAFIKARPVAGELAIGIEFLKDLTPFIWRKYFDYAAIADIHAMKRQIHTVRGHAEIAVAGHDIKLGRGGIREIEFFVQTQQLIYGGRRPGLRGRRTLDMLQELLSGGWINTSAAGEMANAYRFLRTLEHRLQMIADEQTQRLPAEPEALLHFARFCGYASISAFGKALTVQLARVQFHYARLFEDAPGLDAHEGSLVFTGTTDDPATLETLSRLGFSDPKAVAETIRGWHFGRRSAVQSPRAREVLTELIPALLKAFGGAGDPDAALLAFDQALGRMPAAVELFSILRSNDRIRDLFADILGSAPRLAQVIATRPHVLDAAIDPASFAPIGEHRLQHRIGEILDSGLLIEDFLDRARDIALEESFLISLRFLAGSADARHTAASYSELAESLVQATLARVRADFALEYGDIQGGSCVIVAFGKLGSAEMTAASDLDLVLLYDFDEDHPESNGPRSLHAVQYYTRLTQRLVSALTVRTKRGPLYDVDMRLRPSGKKGPLATQIKGFISYQMTDAEIWEHMALTRARVIAGDDHLHSVAAQAIRSVLSQKRDDMTIRKAVLDMRQLIAQEKGDSDPFDLKLARGALMDIEFIAQYLVLVHACTHPDLLRTSTDAVLIAARDKGILSPANATVLIEAFGFYSAMMQAMRLAIEGPFKPAQTPKGILQRMARVAELPDFRTLERSLIETQRNVRKIFVDILQYPKT